LPLATWLLGTNGKTTFVQGEFVIFSWGGPLLLTSYAVSIAVNTLVTGLIVFRIIKVFLEIKAATTSIERTLGTTGGTKLRNVIFIIIESGMTLLAVQLVRFVLSTLPSQLLASTNVAYELSIGINEMFNVIIRAVHFYFSCFTDIIYLARASHQQ
jgi:hypothetical protein